MEAHPQKNFLSEKKMEKRVENKRTKTDSGGEQSQGTGGKQWMQQREETRQRLQWYFQRTTDSWNQRRRDLCQGAGNGNAEVNGKWLNAVDSRMEVNGRTQRTDGTRSMVGRSGRSDGGQ